MPYNKHQSWLISYKLSQQFPYSTWNALLICCIWLHNSFVSFNLGYFIRFSLSLMKLVFLGNVASYLPDFNQFEKVELSLPFDSVVYCPSLSKWRRQWHPTPVLLPGKSHGWRSVVGCSPWGCQESDTTEWLHFHFSLSCIGEGNGNPIRCSCLENPRDGGAWWASVYGVAQSRTWLKWLSSSSSIHIGNGLQFDMW